MGGAASSRDIGRFLQGETVHHASNSRATSRASLAASLSPLPPPSL